MCVLAHTKTKIIRKEEEKKTRSNDHDERFFIFILFSGKQSDHFFFSGDDVDDDDDGDVTRKNPTLSLSLSFCCSSFFPPGKGGRDSSFKISSINQPTDQPTNHVTVCKDIDV